MVMNDQPILNAQQQAAITYGDGPLLIIAGAGTGKTTVVTQRIKYLITEKNIDPKHILALTFTEKAAKEMEERVDILLPYGYTNLWIHTFHSFCDRILRDEAHYLGLDSNYKLLSESESVMLLRNALFDMNLKLFKPLNNPTKFLDALLSHFARLKDEDITPLQYYEWAEKQKDSEEKNEYLELAYAYKSYEEVKIQNSAMDFSDLIANTLLLFRTKKHILEKYQKQFQYMLVDEFQDTNYAQNELAILLAGKEKNITVVADDDQSIYRFRGAAVSNVLQFRENFQDAKIITLIQNYRSTQTILDSAYALIQHNNPNRLEIVENINKKLVSNHKDKSQEIQFIHSLRAEDEAEEITKKIIELSKKYAYKDIAILVRANSHAQLITTALQRYAIPYQFLGPSYLFQQEEVKDLIAYLMFLANLSDTVSLFRVLSMSIFDIPYVDLNMLLTFAKQKNISLYEALQSLEELELKPDIKEKLEIFSKMIEKHLGQIKKYSPGQILYNFLTDSGLYKTLQKTSEPNDEKKVQNIAKFFDRVKRFETGKNNATIFTLVDWLNLMLEMEDSPTAADVDTREENAVSISTVHSAKGLEFAVVFLVNLVSDRFPSRERSEKIPLPPGLLKEILPENTDFHLQEERRLFYVGMTRAKELLHFTAADFYGAAKREKKLSPFIFESLPNLQVVKHLEHPSQQLSLSEVISPFVEKSTAKNQIVKSYKVDYITFSNLQLFSICPLHYRAKIILNLPTPKLGVQSFGISMHKTLYEFYKLVQTGEKPNLKILKDLLQKSWLTEGYENKKDEIDHMKAAEKMLDQFYENEKPFPQPLALELPFSFTLKNGVKVFGQIDRIDKKGDGIEIIDYKTGVDNPNAKKIHEEQLAIYALAATRVKDEVLNYDAKDITVTLHFLGDNTKKSMTFTQDYMEKLEDKLIKDIEKIEQSDFTCSKSILCTSGTCEYKILCKTSN